MTKQDADSTVPPRWLEVASTAEIQRRKMIVVDAGELDIVVGWHEDRPYAMANICVHRDRELARGMIFQDRLVCPGHQWAFDIDNGYCRERDRWQPVYRTELRDDVVYVDASAPVSISSETAVAAPRSASEPAT